MTWEPAEYIPNIVIEEFERGTVGIVSDYATPTGIRQTVYTLTVASSQSHYTTIAYGPSADRPVIKESKGCV